MVLAARTLSFPDVSIPNGAGTAYPGFTPWSDSRTERYDYYGARLVAAKSDGYILPQRFALLLNQPRDEELFFGARTTHADNLQLFTVRDAAKLLDLSEHTIRRLIKQRKLPVVRIEQRVMVTRSGMAQLIKKNTYEITSECSNSARRLQFTAAAPNRHSSR
jgi:excisionase family DNA binding protein